MQVVELFFLSSFSDKIKSRIGGTALQYVLTTVAIRLVFECDAFLRPHLRHQCHWHTLAKRILQPAALRFRPALHLAGVRPVGKEDRQHLPLPPTNPTPEKPKLSMSTISSKRCISWKWNVRYSGQFRRMLVVGMVLVMFRFQVVL